MDVFRQRLEDEYDANVIITAPTVPYKGKCYLWRGSKAWTGVTVVYRDKEIYISNPTEFPDTTDTASKVKEIQEPIVKASIIVPEGEFRCFIEC